MVSTWLLSLFLEDMSIVDSVWGIGFVLLAWASLPYEAEVRQYLVTTLVTIWGIRLSVHITKRNHNKGEDKRYAAWRKEWGKWTSIRSLFQVFLLQGLIMLLVALPVLWINTYNLEPISYRDIIAIMLWLTGFYFEVVGDYQLAAFKKDPHNEGQVLHSGLWRYTRHPNYFGESVMWWAIWLMATNVQQGWMTIVSPILLTFLLLKVSGVSLTEKHLEGNGAYIRYQRTTSAFFPWLPKQ